jgi:hypothetical protein
VERSASQSGMGPGPVRDVDQKEGWQMCWVLQLEKMKYCNAQVGYA